MPLPLEGNLTVGWDKSFADDLIVRLGAVSSRVALLLRSAEAKPFSCLDLYVYIYIYMHLSL